MFEWSVLPTNGEPDPPTRANVANTDHNDLLDGPLPMVEKHPNFSLASSIRSPTYLP